MKCNCTSNNFGFKVGYKYLTLIYDNMPAERMALTANVLGRLRQIEEEHTPDSPTRAWEVRQLFRENTFNLNTTNPYCTDDDAY